MTVVIYFVGLIAHLTYTPQNQPTRQVAALVYEMNHSPQLIVPSGSVLTSRKEFPKVMANVDSVGRYHYDLKGVGAIRILGLSADDMFPSTSDFRTDLIGLKIASGNQNLKPEVQDEKLFDGAGMQVAWAYVELQGGSLGVAGYYSVMGSYNKGVPTCVPSEVVFTAKSAGSVVEFISDNGYDMRVSAGAPIVIANLPPAAMTGHFPEHGKLLVGNPKVGTWTLPGLACTTKPIFDTGSLGKGDGVDCTNTHFP